MDETEVTGSIFDSLNQAVGTAVKPKDKTFADLDAVVGRPEWKDPQYSAESRLKDIQDTHIAAGKPYEQAAAKAKESVGVELPRPEYRLGEERQKAAMLGTNPVTGQLDPTTLQAIGKVLPGTSEYMGWRDKREYGRAVDRFKKGEATEDDYRTIAMAEEQQSRQEKQGIGASLIQSGAQLPAFVASAGAGGAAGRMLIGGTGRIAGTALGRTVGMGGAEAAEAAINNPLTRNVAGTALTPAMWAERGAQNLNEAKDRDSFLQGVQSYGSAVAVGTIQNAILGQLAGAAKPGEKLLGSTLKRTGLGIVEQQAADTVTSALGMTTGYGTIGELAKDPDQGVKSLAVQAMTFAAFANLHRTGSGKEMLDKVSERLETLHKADVPVADAVNIVAKEGILKPPHEGEPVDPNAWMEANRPGEPQSAAPETPKTAPPLAEVPPERPIAQPEPPKAAEKAPEAAKQARPEEYAALKDAVQRGQTVEPDHLFDAAGLTDREQQVLGRMFLGHEPSEIGKPEEVKAQFESALGKLGIDPKALPADNKDFAKLTAREQQVLFGRQTKSLRDMGKEMGVSYERVRQIEKAAQEKVGKNESVAKENEKEKLSRAADYSTKAKTAVGEELEQASAANREEKWMGLGDEVLALVETDRRSGTLTEARAEKLYDLLQSIDQGREGGKSLTKTAEAKFRQQIDGLRTSGASQASRGTGKKYGSSGIRRQPTPVPGEDVGGVQEGNVNAPRNAQDAGVPAAALQEGVGGSEANRPDAQNAAGNAPAAASGGEAAGSVNPRVPQVDVPTNPITNTKPGDPVPGVTRGANASTPLTQAQIDAAIPQQGITALRADGTPAIPPSVGEPKVRSGIAAAWRWLRRTEESVGSVIAPYTSELNKEAGQATARLAAVPDKLARTVQYYSNQLLDHLMTRAKTQVEAELATGGSGLKATRKQIEDTAFKNGDDHLSVANELRMRKTRAEFQARENAALERAARSSDPDVISAARKEAAEWKDKADEIRTMVGTKFHDETDFQRKANSQGFKDFAEWWGQKGGVSEKLEELYRIYHGMDPTETIDSISQLPGLVFHAKAIREGDSIPDNERVMGGTRKGNLLNPRQKKLGASYAYTGAAEAYDTNPFRVIEYSFAKRMQNAEQTNFIRTQLAAKTSDGKPVMYAKLPGSDLLPGYRIITTNKLPPEIRTGYPAGTEINVAVHPDTYLETYRVMNLDMVGELSKRIGNVIGKALDIPTAINIFGIAEATSHCIGNAVKVFAKAGIRSLPDMARNIRDVMRQKDSTLRELLAESEQGRLKPQHAETSLDRPGLFGGGRYDPTRPLLELQKNTVGKWMDRFDDALRLTMSHAYDRIAEAYPGVASSEKNKTDFINQLGNYQKTTQAWAVSILRDLRIGPFATAATNNVMQSVRSLGLGRGIDTKDWKTNAKLRAELGLQVAGVLGVGALVNYLLHGRPDGDDNTPLGGLKLPGNNGYVDLAALTNIRRGSKTVGLQSVIEGNRYGGKGATSGNIGSNAMENALEAVVHPAAGPAVNLAREAVVGMDVIGRDTVDRKDQHNMWAKLQAALMNASPTAEAALKLSGVKTHPGKKEDAFQTAIKGAGLGAIIKKGAVPPGKPLPVR
jgi:hypothetical protein